MNIDEINNAQDTAINTLRERIMARKALHEEELVQSAGLGFIAPQRSFRELPEVNTPVGGFHEFSYERFIEVQERLDVAYCNWLCCLEKKETGELFEKTLKELVQTVDLFVGESLRVRY